MMVALNDRIGKDSSVEMMRWRDHTARPSQSHQTLNVFLLLAAAQAHTLSILTLTTRVFSRPTFLFKFIPWVPM